jgi:hypothetical protein
MQFKYFSVWAGGVYLLLGILGFIPFLVSEPPTTAPNMNVTSAFGQLFAIFPVNSVLNIFHAILGIIGIYAFTGDEQAKSYTRWCAAICGVMSILGMLPFARTFFGLLPLYSHNIWLHGITAMIGSILISRKLKIAAGGGAESLGTYRESRRTGGQERKPSDLDKAG